jgi:hypothetical protein
MMKGSYISTRQLSRRLSRYILDTRDNVSQRNASITILRRPLSSSSSLPQPNGLTPEGEVVIPLSTPQHEVVRFPSSKQVKKPIVAAASNDKEDSVPVLLNSKEHAVGYLSKILNARVYDAAIETELQEAKNLSSV